MVDIDWDSPALEGRWDCPSCGQVGILARHDECTNPKCRAAKPGNVRYYLPDDANVLSAEELEAMGGDQEEWACGGCGAINNANLTHCKECGLAKDTLEVTDATFAFVGHGEGTTGTNSATAAVGRNQSSDSSFRRDYSNDSSYRVGNTSFKQSGSMGNVLTGPLKLVLGLGAVISVGALVAVTIHNFTKPFEVTAIAQEPALVYLQPVEASHPVTEKSFTGTYPAGAYNISGRQWLDTGRDTQEPYQGTCTRQVDSGRRTPVTTVPGQRVHVGNGVYRTTSPTTRGGDIIYTDENYSCTKYRSVDVYDWGNTYQINRWSHARTLRETGTRDNPPERPTTLDLRSNERFSLSSRRRDVHRVTFEDPHTDKTWERSEDTEFSWYNNLNGGESCTLTVNRLGSLLEINSCE